MGEPEAPRGDDLDFSWHVVARRSEIGGEARANVVRMAGIGVFYGIELASYHGLSIGGFDLRWADAVGAHRAISALCAAWALLGLGVFAALRAHRVPEWLKYATTIADAVFLTAVLTVGEAARSPVVVVYFLVVGLAGLRMSLPLVRCATVACALGYLWLLGWAEWFATRDVKIPRFHQAVFLAALAFAGVLIGQVVRHARAVAEQYAARREAAERAGRPPP